MGEVMKLEKDDLMAICQRHPEFSHRIRRAQIKLAMWRGFIYAANARKTKSSSWEKAFMADQRRALAGIPEEEKASKSRMRASNYNVVNTQGDPLYGGSGSSTGGAVGDVSITRELQLLGQRFDDGIGDLRNRLERLDTRVQQIEQRTTRSRYCRAM